MTKIFREPFVFQLFCFWVLALPFFRISLVGTLSVDNILTPVIFFLWVFAVVMGLVKLGLNSKLPYLLIITLLFMFSLAGDFLGGPASIMNELGQLLKWFAYLLLPILCIQNERQFELASKVVVLSTVIVCCSAILDSLGIFSLSFLDVADRSGDIRLELSKGNKSAIGALKRSAGLVGEFGTMALLVAFTISTIFFANKEKLAELGFKSSKFWSILIAFSLLLGAIAAQSRNVVISSFIVVLMSVCLSFILEKKGSKAVIALLLFAFLGFVVTVIVIYNSVLIYNAVLGEGSMKASGDARIDQYAWAFELVKDSLFFGVDAAKKAMNAEEIAAIHNLWLYQLVSNGVIGLIPLLILFIKLVSDTFKLTRFPNFKQRAKNIFGMTLAMMLAVSFYAAQGSLMFWFFLGLLIAFNTSLRNKRRVSYQTTKSV